jgi:hypothetical protein
MKAFLDLPERIYRGDPNYVPPLRAEVRRTLDGRRNPYFAGTSLRLFVCYDDREVVARLAIVLNPRYEERFGVRAAFFGFFEAKNNPAAVSALFASAKAFCRSRGATRLEGPFNPNHYSELGLLVDHFDDPPVFFQTYNPSYYPALLEAEGFAVSALLFTGRNDHVRRFVEQHFSGEAPSVLPAGYHLRPLDAHRKGEEMETMRKIFNDAFASNWHFLPASKEEYDYAAKYLGLITNPSLVRYVEYRGEQVAVLLCVPDVNPLIRQFKGRRGPLKLLRFLRGRSAQRTVIVYAVGIRQRFQQSRVYPLLLAECARMAAKYDVLECTWISEGNRLAARSAERLGMHPHKHFAIYALPLVPESGGESCEGRFDPHEIRGLAYAKEQPTEANHG